jgi:hypothetical protein
MRALTFAGYVENVLNPIVNGAADKDALAAWLSRQVEEWEIEAERPEGEPIAGQVVEALEQTLGSIA